MAEIICLVIALGVASNLIAQTFRPKKKKELTKEEKFLKAAKNLFNDD